MTYIYYVDRASNVTTLVTPVAHSNRVHLDPLIATPLTDGPEPTIAEVTTAIGIRTNVFVYYTGSLVATDTPLYTWNVDDS